MIASASARATASPTAPASRPSATTASAPSRRRESTLPALRVIAVTWWPRSINWRTSGLPIAPVAPATKTRISGPPLPGSGTFRTRDEEEAARVTAGAGPASRLEQRPAVAVDDVRVEARARLGRALLRLEVHVHDAEALRVAIGPLEVVQQRPGEVAAHVHALVHGLVEHAQVLAQVGDALRVVDAALGRHGRVGERGAVLGDVDRHVAVALADPPQRVQQPLRVDLPAHLGVGRARLADAGDARRKRGRIIS